MRAQWRLATTGVGAVLLLLGLRACGGSEFAAEGGGNPDASAGSGGTATGGNAGTGGGSAGSGTGGGGTGGSVGCAGPEDCFDAQSCTVDVCGIDGTCGNVDTCSAGARCCGATCGQCCDSNECNDGIDCTVDSCGQGVCSNIPNDEACGDGSYCSPNRGCVQIEQCNSNDGCNDEDPCTTDECHGNLCEHNFCEGSLLCCPGGCAECCGDTECDDGDPCTDNVCNGGQCQVAARCTGEEEQCCDDGSCGTCCRASDCDDGVGCTYDKCQNGSCNNDPNDGACTAGGQVCDPVAGCTTPVECTKASECDPTGTGCETIDCVNGSCTYDYCPSGTQCCGAAGGNDSCATCCENSQCDDFDPCTIDTCDPSGGGCSNEPMNCGSGLQCCNGQCASCCTNDDCDDPSDPGGDGCNQGVCSQGICVTVPGCSLNQMCCPGAGCVAPGEVCVGGGSDAGP